MRSFPKSEKEAKARSMRKLKALKRRSEALLLEIAAYWDIGPVSSEIDQLLQDIETGAEAIVESMDLQMQMSAEREDW